MANDEASFKSEFFTRDLRRYYGRALHMWSHSDWASSGLPDKAILFRGCYMPIESKFVLQPPARDASKLLKRELTAKQAEHLTLSNFQGGSAAVLVGFATTSVLVPFSFWPENALNITYGFIKELVEEQPELEFKKVNGVWNNSSFLAIVKRWRPINRG